MSNPNFLAFDITIAAKYTSASQKARVLTEDWVLRQIYCPNCGDDIYGYDNNRPVADFHCKNCVEDFELKSKKGKLGNKVAAGAYGQMIKRINSPERPNFFFMGYLAAWTVNDFLIIPKHFFVSEIVEERKPLATTARRAGWIGSNILLSQIPKAGHIYYVEEGHEVAREDVLDKWQKTLFLRQVEKPESKGWILDIMKCIDALHKDRFSLKDLYEFEADLAELHPENKNIRPKIRQQLQLLRDKGYLEFLERGEYRLR